jgi:hypothetical protein
MGGQYFGRREKQDCPLKVKYALCGAPVLLGSLICKTKPGTRSMSGNPGYKLLSDSCCLTAQAHPKAEFLDIIRTKKVLRVFLLAFHSHLY